MKMATRFVLYYAATLFCSAPLIAQQQSNITWDEATDEHLFINGEKLELLTGNGFTVLVGLSGNQKYLRVDVSVLNNSTASVDLIPESISANEMAPKEKILSPVDIAKLMRSMATRVAMANTLTIIGANMQRQQSTTYTTNMASNGASGTGFYSGSSVSTTSTPNYAAQTRAREIARERNAEVAATTEKLSQAIMKANTVVPNQNAGGSVVFESDKKATAIMIAVPVGSTVFKFPFKSLGH